MAVYCWILPAFVPDCDENVFVCPYFKTSAGFEENVLSTFSTHYSRFVCFVCPVIVAYCFSYNRFIQCFIRERFLFLPSSGFNIGFKYFSPLQWHCFKDQQEYFNLGCLIPLPLYSSFFPKTVGEKAEK